MTPRRVWIARALAVCVDALQISLFPWFFPGFLSPLNVVTDVVAAFVFWGLLGWHPLLLPTFIIEQLPIVDLAPTWTIAVLIVTRQSNRLRSVSCNPVIRGPESTAHN